ncbi:MAG: ABC transporter permease, partial [Eubacteriales bacterium]
MAKFILKRICMAIFTILMVTCITFLLTDAVPGNPWLSEKSPSDAVIAALNEKYGLDQPLHIRLGKYLGNLVQGDLGVSIKMQKNYAVTNIIRDMFPVSAKIGICALAWAICVGVPIGCIAAYNRGNGTDSGLRVLCTLGISTPTFVVATLLMYVFAGTVFDFFPTLFDGSARSYVLPCLSLG